MYPPIGADGGSRTRIVARRGRPRPRALSAGVWQIPGGADAAGDVDRDHDEALIALGVHPVQVIGWDLPRPSTDTRFGPAETLRDAPISETGHCVCQRRSDDLGGVGAADLRRIITHLEASLTALENAVPARGGPGLDDGRRPQHTIIDGRTYPVAAGVGRGQRWWTALGRPRGIRDSPVIDEGGRYPSAPGPIHGRFRAAG